MRDADGLHTRSARTVLDWSESQDGVYHMLVVEGVPHAGVMTSQDKHTPPMWVAYVQVTDCDATTSKAKELRASIFVETTFTVRFDLGRVSDV